MRRTCTAVCLLAMLAGTAAAQTPVDTGWTFQGKLSDGGVPASGLYDLRFSLFLDELATIPAGTVIDLPGTSVDAGLFSVRLDFGQQFTGLKTWLVVEVSPEGLGTYTALPAQEITSAPQSLFTQLLGLPFAGGGVSADAALKILNSDDTTGAAIRGQSTGESGFTFGGDFSTSSVDGRGVRGQALATSGGAVGGRFSSASTGGIGAWATANAASGATYGLYGESFSNGGIGVRGFASASNGLTIGVHGLNYSTSGVAVRGEAAATSGSTYGGDFSTASPDGRAVRGAATAATGSAVGGRFSTTSTSGLAVWGSATAATGETYGVYGEVNSGAGYGGRFRNFANGGVGVYVQGTQGGVIEGQTVGLSCAALLGSGTTYAVTGTAMSAAGFGGYFSNIAPGGTALWADGLCKVKTLQILGGADVAEPFDVRDAREIVPGMVVVIDPDHPGDLRLTDRPYDATVAGVVSGANGLAPGMVMKAEGQAEGKHPVAMTGRVWCLVDASQGAVVPGDRLTTSPTPGHAMKAGDAARAPGAVIGKAMTGLSEGKGLVLVLVNLQ